MPILNITERKILTARAKDEDCLLTTNPTNVRRSIQTLLHQV